jgi:HK97 gp10 family phage protein
MADTIYVMGLDELQARLRDLPKRIGRNVLRGAMNAGATVIRKEVQARAPVYTGSVAAGHPPPGTLRRSIYQVQIREFSNDQRQTYQVGVRKGKRFRKQGKRGQLSQDAFYAHFVEFGTVKMAARPFMRPGFEASKSAAVQAVREYLEKRIPDEIAKLGGGGK